MRSAIEYTVCLREGSQQSMQKAFRMSLDAIYQKLTDILRDVFDEDTLVARPDLTADQVDGWDSFAHLRLMFTVEKSFGVSFAASEISSLQNVGDLAKMIGVKIGAPVA
jgi:acyl carrier protein